MYTPTHRKKKHISTSLNLKLWWAGELFVAGESLPCGQEQGKKPKDAGNHHCFLPVVSWAADRPTPQAASLPVVAAKPLHSHQRQTVGECQKSPGSWCCSPPVLEQTPFLLAWSVWLSRACLNGTAVRGLIWERLVSGREELLNLKAAFILISMKSGLLTICQTYPMLAFLSSDWPVIICM